MCCALDDKEHQKVDGSDYCQHCDKLLKPDDSIAPTLPMPTEEEIERLK